MKIFGNLILALAATFPAQHVTSQEVQRTPTYIQVEGSRTNALRLLKAGGIQAKETKTQRFVPPDVMIGGVNGPVDYGEMVILTADFDVNKLPDGLVDIRFNWSVLDEGKQKKVFVADGGRQIAFAVGMRPRRIVVILDVNCLFENKETVIVVEKDGKNPTPREVISEAQAISPSPIFSEIIVGNGPAPTPPLPPTPTPPNPTPPSPPAPPIFPDGQFGLAKFMFDTFNADTNLTRDVKLALAEKLASNLEGIAAKIGAISDYRDLSTILADTKRGNDSAFSGIPGFDANRAESLKLAIRNKIAQLYKDQKINRAEDIAIAWREMSQGLRALR